MRALVRGVTAVGLLALGVLGCSHADTPSGPAPEPSSSAPLCAAPAPGAAPLRPLTRFQYDNALRDLLGVTSRPAQAGFPPENEVDGYRTFAAANPANPRLVESYLTTAEAVAAQVVNARLTEVAPCAAGADGSACGQAFIGSLAEKAFRRPATAAELAALSEVFTAGSRKSYAHGIELVLQAVLQAPQFLYRAEALRAATPETGAVPLGGYELASRLSFLLWGSVPDATLLQMAGSGALSTPLDVEREARRLLADGRAQEVVRDFSEQWLELSRLEGAARVGSTLEPGALTASLRGSVDRFVLEAYRTGGTFQSLFSESAVWLDGGLAPLFGATLTNPAAPANEFQAATLAEPRFGLLSQPALLALLSHADQTAPVLRGAFVRERILCLEVLPPPPGINAVPPDPDPTATTRERFRQHTEQSACAGCHALIDGIGFGFERYDQLGRYRATENGLPVDESGTILATGEAGLDGPYASASEMLSRIAQSERARDCLATNWFRYAFGRTEQPADQCSVTQLTDRFRESGGSLSDLLVGLTQTDAFLYRPAITEAP